MTDPDSDVSESDADVHHRSVFNEPAEDPTTELVGVITELKGVEQDDLDPLYSWADSLIHNLYSSPPPAEAQAMVKFTYEGYRITLYQDGQAVFMGRNSSE